MLLNNKILVTLLFLVVPFITPASYAKIDSDSLAVLLSSYKTPQDKINFLNENAKNYMQTDSSFAFLCLDKAIDLAEQNDLKVSLGDSYRNLGNIYNMYGYGYQTRDSYLSSYEYYTLANDSLGLARITNNLGCYYYKWHNSYNKSLLFLKRSLELKKMLNLDDGSLANTYFNLGNVYLLLNNYMKSLKYFFNSLEIVEKTDEHDKIADIQNHIAQVYIEVEEFEKAKKYLNLSKELSLKSGDMVELADNHLLFSNMFIESNKLDSALIELRKAEEIFNDKHYLLGLGKSYNNYIKLYSKRNKYDKVLEYSFLAKDIYLESGSTYDLALTYNSIGTAYYKLKKHKQSRKYINKSKALCDKNNFLEISVNNFLYSGQLDYIDKKYKDAYSNFMSYATLRDSIFNINKTKIISEVEDKYAINKKEAELELLSKEKQKVEIERDRNKTTSNYLMLIIILVLIVLGLIFYLYYSNRKLNETLEDLVQERTKELKKTNKLLANSKKNEEDVSRIKSDLLKNISESLKDPISEIQNLVKILKEENEDNYELYEQLELITSSTYRLNSIIKSITELYSLEEKKKSGNDEEFEFDKLIVDIVDHYKILAQSRELDIKIENTSTIIFTHDMKLISNAFDHLMKTVVDYANKGKINIRLLQDENSKIIEMCSSNFNINKKVFNRDLSTNTDSDIYQIDRMFINLYVTKKMIDKMGGSIHWESSNSGEGIRFVMIFPNDVKFES